MPALRPLPPPARPWARSFAALAVAAAVLGACSTGTGGGPGTSSPRAASGAVTPAPPLTPSPGSTTGGSPQSGLGAAFAVAPQGTSDLEFVDWDARKLAFGVSGPSSSMTAADRAAFFQRLLHAGVTQGTEIGVPDKEQFATWGFDAIDLAWEAHALPSNKGAPVVVLAFDEGGFDVSSLPERFESCGYQRTGSGDATVYTTGIDNACLVSPIGLPTLPTGATSAAVVPDRNLLLLSFGPSEIASEQDLLAKGGPTLADDANARELVDALSGGDTASLFFGRATCSDLATSSLRRPTPANVRKLQRVRTEFGGRPYLAIGASQQLAPTPGDGTVAFLYPSDADAAADLPVRSRADTAPSLVASKTYGEFAFRVDAAKADGTLLRLDVSEPNGATSGVLDVFDKGDMTFALC